MSEAIVVTNFRRRLAKQACEGTAVPKLAYMAFGDGGHNGDLTAKTPDANRTTLVHELLRKPLREIYQEDLLSATAAGTLETNELLGAKISEAGIFDAAGNLVGYKFFAPKIKEADEEYTVRIRLRF